VKSEYHARFLSIICQADNGCLHCVSTLLALYCIEFEAPPEMVAEAAISVSHLHAPKDLLTKLIDEKRLEIAATLPINSVPV